MDNRKITIHDENGNASEIEVIDIFNVRGYEGKDYILYTKNVETGIDQVEVFVSILEQNDEGYSFKYIEDEKEWEEVQKALEEIGGSNGRDE